METANRHEDEMTIIRCAQRIDAQGRAFLKNEVAHKVALLLQQADALLQDKASYAKTRQA